MAMKILNNIKTLITADDFGFSENINRAIFEAYENKRITEMSLMVDCFGSEEAFKYVRENKVENVGLHFSLVRISKNGKILRGDDYDRMLRDWTPEQLQKAFDEEVSIFENSVGFKPKHIIGHKHISLNLKLVKYVADYCIKNNCYARRGERSTKMQHFTLKADPIPEGLKIGRIVDSVLGFKYGSPEEMCREYKDEIEALKANNNQTSIEIFFHPGYSGDFEKLHTSFVQERIDDINFLMSDWFLKLIEEENLELLPSSEI
ncbi:hypothetical protein A3D00_02605 [Candidatus Woesebacteria bacterium RIFCSPHIGHO2_02_FULL_38_9]|nr:MAG: hypothetical protein A3D00_02605 [Candidatus Woesebacteria bacterium RIFCSPHIGHO2_02_FULL_38_9]